LEYCSYWTWHNENKPSDQQNIFGQYIRGCYEPCVGIGNTRLSTDACRCKCPDAKSPGQGVYNNPNTGAHVCYDCGVGYRFSPLSNSPFYECNCLNVTCGGGNSRLGLNYSPNPSTCNCECKPERAKCGAKTITVNTKTDTGLFEYSYRQDICCEPGQICVNGKCKPGSSCSCVNKGPYSPPSSWVLLMAIGSEGVFTLDSGSVSSVSSAGNVTLNGLKATYRRPGGSPIAPNTIWRPLTTVILILNCGGYNPYQLAIWDNYGQSTNPRLEDELIINGTYYNNNVGIFNTFPNRCGSEELINVDNITSQTVCNQTASDNPEQLISWEC